MDANLSKWEDYYKLACAFYQQHGHLDIPQRYVVIVGNDTFKLGSWINNQRDEYKSGMLSENRIKLLESIKIRWSIKPFLWEDKFKLAKAYYEYYGNLEVPRSFNTKNGYDFNSSEDSTRLGKWINMQRTEYKNGKLSEERIKLLESIGMKWLLRKRKSKNDNKSLCEEYNLDYEKYHDLLKIPYEVLSAKINYLNSNNIPLIINDELNPIFFMSDINMQVVYGISLEDLVKEYSSGNKRGGK